VAATAVLKGIFSWRFMCCCSASCCSPTCQARLCDARDAMRHVYADRGDAGDHSGRILARVLVAIRTPIEAMGAFRFGVMIPVGLPLAGCPLEGCRRQWFGGLGARSLAVWRNWVRSPAFFVA
jgi:hypothetical protein